MNKRIRELAEKSYIYDRQNDSSFFNKELFAELIVRECASELIRWKDEPFPYDPEFGAKLIKQHFGVDP